MDATDSRKATRVHFSEGSAQSPESPVITLPVPDPERGGHARPSAASGGSEQTFASSVLQRRPTTRSLVQGVARTPVVATDAVLDHCCRRKRWQLIVSVICGCVAVYIHSSQALSDSLFGTNFQHSWLWWTTAVPLYVYLAIYFTRFVGAFLVRTWLREASESPALKQAVISLLKGLVQDDEFIMLTTSILEHESIVSSLAGLTAAVLRAPVLHRAAASATAAVLSSKEVQAAGVEAACASMQSPAVTKGLEALLDEPKLLRPLAGQLVRLCDDPRVRQAVAGLLHELLEDSSVKEVVHVRAVSLVNDRNLIEAGRKGVVGALFGCGPDNKGDDM